jgi:site-specific DNA recombinase
MRVIFIEPTVVKESKKRVCAYARVSTDHVKQEESLENQITYYERLIAANPEYVFVGVFADQGISGTTDNRPEFRRMLDLAKQGAIDLIITKSISRFARNTAALLQRVRELKDLGVEIKFEKENISTLSGDGELMLTVLSSFAQEESKNISDNVKWAIKKKFERGELMINTQRFLGYDKDEHGNLIINKEEGEIVKQIFTEYLEGKGTFTIAKDLNASGFPTVAGGIWQESTILNMLKNEKYKGDVLLQKYYTPDHLKGYTLRNNGEQDSYYIEDNHPPIISKEIWEAVQMELKVRAAAKGNDGDTDKYQNRYPLTGMLFCGTCGATLKRRIWNSKLPCKKVVWQCSNYIKNGKKACPGTKIDDEVAGRINIKEETIVQEVMKNGKKHYHYTSKYKQDVPSRTVRAPEKENGSVLPSVDRPIRTVIKL